jgi:predicted metal-dependent TIM-barrel fold hydrolase
VNEQDYDILSSWGKSDVLATPETKKKMNDSILDSNDMKKMVTHLKDKVNSKKVETTSVRKPKNSNSRQ